MSNFDDLNPKPKMITKLILNLISGERTLVFKNSGNIASSFIILEQPKPPLPGQNMPQVENTNQLATLLLGGITQVWLEYQNKPITDFSGDINDLSAINHCVGENGGTLKDLRAILQYYTKEYLAFPAKAMLAYAAYNVFGAMLAANSYKLPVKEFKETGNFPGEQVFIVWRVTGDNENIIISPVNRQLLENILVFHANTYPKLSDRLIGPNEYSQFNTVTYSKGNVTQETWPNNSDPNSAKLILGTGLPVQKIRLTPNETGVQYFVGIELLATPDKIYIRPTGGKLGDHVPRTAYEDILKFIIYVATNHATIIGNDRELMLALQILVDSGLNRQNEPETLDFIYNFILPIFISGLHNFPTYLSARDLIRKPTQATATPLLSASPLEKSFLSEVKKCEESAIFLSSGVSLDFLSQKLIQDNLLTKISRAAKEGPTVSGRSEVTILGSNKTLQREWGARGKKRDEEPASKGQKDHAPGSHENTASPKPGF